MIWGLKCIEVYKEPLSKTRIVGIITYSIIISAQINELNCG